MTPTDDPPDPGGPDGPGAFGNEERPITTEDLIALREGDLDEEQARRVRERIESDPEAVAELLDQLDQTDALLERFRTQPPPPELSERLDAVIADEIAARDARRSGDDPPDVDGGRR